MYWFHDSLKTMWISIETCAPTESIHMPFCDDVRNTLAFPRKLKKIQKVNVSSLLQIRFDRFLNGDYYYNNFSLSTNANHTLSDVRSKLRLFFFVQSNTLVCSIRLFVQVLTIFKLDLLLTLINSFAQSLIEREILLITYEI